MGQQKTPIEEVRKICAQLGGAHPHPDVQEFDWAFWLAEFPGVPQALTCPKCGERLRERNGKRGRFLGCNGYPRCRYTQSF
jgi:hypothetical protein